MKVWGMRGREVVEAAYRLSDDIADLLDELALEFDCYFVPLAGELRRRAPRCESLCRRLDGMLDSDALGCRFDDVGGT